MQSEIWLCDFFTYQRWQERIRRRTTGKTRLDLTELLEPVSNLGALRKVPISVAKFELVRRKYSRITSAKSPPLWKTTFIASLDKYYFLRAWVTRPQLLRQRTNTGTSTAIIAETHWSTRTRLRALYRLVTSGRLANFTCALSWRLCGNIPDMLEFCRVDLFRKVTERWWVCVALY